MLCKYSLHCFGNNDKIKSLNMFNGGLDAPITGLSAFCNSCFIELRICPADIEV